jgi:cell division septation protein DedD
MLLTPRPLHVRVPRALLLVGIGAAFLVPVVAQAATSSTYSLMSARSANRSSAVALSGTQISGNAYIFLTPTSGVTKVSFWLDNPSMTGAATHVEGSAPLDFAGTDSAGKAKPWNTAVVAAGAHSITALIVTKSATTTLTTSFSVSSAVAPTATPTAKPSATATAAATPTPTPKPTATPTPKPTASPTPKPTATPTALPTATPAPTATSTTLPAGFVGHSGTQFTLGGQPFTFTGFNIYQANSRANCSYTMGTGSALDTALNSIGSGLEVFRAWFFQRLATTNGARDWTAFDHTLAVARAHNVKVVVTLANQWGSCESPTSVYKTDSWYTGGYKTDVLPDNTVSYRQWVQEVVSRYKNDPTIAMWQLMNEAEIKTSDSASSCAPTADLYNFAADVSGLIKSIDPNHLVNLGTMGGGQCGSQGADYQKLGAIPSIDVLEFHDYGHNSTALPSNLASDITASKALGKPIFVGEAGIQVASGGSLSTRASEFDAKVTAQLGAGVGGFLVWSWNNSPSNPASWEVGPGDPTLGVIDSH